MLLMASTTIASFAQTSPNIVRGVVVNEQQEPLVGAAILQMGTSNGVSSGINGEFALELTQGGRDFIQISFFGYKSIDLSITSSLLQGPIVLQEDTQNVDEVVVIGYGTVKKNDMTGSVTTVKADQLNKGVASTPSSLLMGKSAGVVVTQGSGQPGAGAAIRIRGGSSLSANNDPLIVVDGLPISNTGISGVSDPLSSINPNDIESFTVLKDASATAIYGSRASNGVIIITTKKGSKYGSGKPTFDADFKASISNNNKYVDVMSADQLRATMTDYANRTAQPDALAALGSSNTDWQKEIYQIAPSYEFNVGMNGNAKFGKVGYMPYRVSVGYLYQEGVLKTSDMGKVTAAFNVNPILFDEHLSVNLNGKFMNMDNTFANQDAISAAVNYDPTQAIYDDSANGLGGYRVWKTDENINTMATMNPVGLLANRVDKANANRYIGSAQFNYKIHGFEELTANVNLGIDYANSNGTDKVMQNSEKSFHDTMENGSGSLRTYDQQKKDLTLESYLSYNKEINKHSVSAMAGYSWQHFHEQSYETKVKLSNDEAIGTPRDFATEYFLVSFYGRFNYTFDNRYMVTATLRNDGTSRFINDKWGLFPSVAAAWNAKNESFLKNVDAISTAKLRLSWGQTGQQDIGMGNYPSMATYKYNQGGSNYYFGNNLIIPITPLGYNADLKWETTTTYNAGIDLGFLNGRITANLDYYQRETTDLINFTPVPAGSNLTNALLANIGSLENRGFEIELNGVAIQTKNTIWNIGVNAAWNKTEITKLTLNDSADYRGADTGPGVMGAVGNTIQKNQVGYAPNTFYVYEQIYNTEGNPIMGAYVDRNEDGQINDHDKYYHEKAGPDVTLGFNTSLTWKNLTVAASAHASVGNYIYNNVRSQRELMTDLWTNNFVSNLMTTAPASNFTKSQYDSDMYIENGSFFKIDNITVSYHFDMFENIKFDVFGTIQNVATFTNYSGLDPEVFSGVDQYVFPRPTTYIIGLKLNF